MDHMSKPLSIIRHDLIEDLVRVINNSNLPAFIIKPILQDLLKEIEKCELKEYEEDKANYDAYLASENEENNV